MIPILIAGMKEQQLQIEKQQEQIEKMEKIIEKLMEGK
jgi:hypothetical protein